MKMRFKHSIIPAIALMVAAGSPASAQLLGGGGGLTGGLGGGLGGTLGQTTGTVTGTATGSASGEKSVDTRSGRVRGSGQAKGSGNGSVTGGSSVLDNPIGGTASGSAEKSVGGSADAALVGTDFVRATAADGVTRTRGAVDSARGTAGSAVGQATNAAGSASGAASGMGSIAGSGNGMAQGSLGQLAASGSAAANGAGMFAIEPGMAIEDNKGRVIGYVQQVQQTKRGVVQAVTVEVGDRVATLPASSFSGSGEALVTGMTKGELKSTAKEQETAADSGSATNSNEAPARQRSSGGVKDQDRQSAVKDH